MGGSKTQQSGELLIGVWLQGSQFDGQPGGVLLAVFDLKPEAPPSHCTVSCVMKECRIKECG